MTGEDLLHLYVYGLALAFILWMVCMGWTVTRSARRLLRRDRPLGATQGGPSEVPADRHRVPAA